MIQYKKQTIKGTSEPNYNHNNNKWQKSGNTFTTKGLPGSDVQIRWVTKGLEGLQIRWLLTGALTLSRLPFASWTKSAQTKSNIKTET